MEHARSLRVDRLTCRSAVTPLVVAWYAATALVALVTGALLVGSASGALLTIGSICLAGGALEAAWSALFARRAGVRVDEDGVTVCNGWREHAFAWSEVRTFAFGTEVESLSRFERVNGQVLQTYLVLSDGRHQVMEGMRSLRSASSRSHVQALLDVLEDARLTSSPSPS